MRELLSRNNEIILQVLMNQVSTKVPNWKSVRVVMRVGIRRHPDIAEQVAG